MKDFLSFYEWISIYKMYNNVLITSMIIYIYIYIINSPKIKKKNIIGEWEIVI